MTRIESRNLARVEIGTEKTWRQSWRAAMRLALAQRHHIERGLERKNGRKIDTLHGSELKAFIRKVALSTFGVPSRSAYFALKRELLAALQ